MTFGEKIQKLRKEAGMSQEELAYRLGVSRQAVSRWETDNGYPETEKIVRMSKIFNTSLDYLLNEEGKREREAAGERGIYVSRETADGFLLYQKRKFMKIAVAAGLMVGSLALSFADSELSMLLFMLLLIIGIVILLSVKMTDNPYKKLLREPLLFDKTVKAELNTAYAEKKKLLHLFTLAGIALIAFGFLFFPLVAAAELPVADTAVFAAGMAAAGIGTFLCIYMSGTAWAYRLLVMNENYHKKGK